MTVLAVLAAAVAALLLVGTPASRSLGRLHARPVRRPTLGRRALLGVLLPLGAGMGAGLTAAATVRPSGWGASLTGAAVGMALAVAVGTAQWLVRRWRRERAAARAAAEVAHGCQVLAGQLRIGHVPSRALEIAAEDCPVLRDGWALHRLGGDVVTAWSAAGERPGHGGLVALARAWQVAQDSGAPMADLLERVAASLRREHRVLGALNAELAGPRATARLLALLPGAGVWLGMGLGGDPAGFLLHHPLGQLCLVAAVALACAGLVWVERIASSVQRSPDRLRSRRRGDDDGR